MRLLLWASCKRRMGFPGSLVHSRVVSYGLIPADSSNIFSHVNRSTSFFVYDFYWRFSHQKMTNGCYLLAPIVCVVVC